MLIIKGMALVCLITVWDGIHCVLIKMTSLPTFFLVYLGTKPDFCNVIITQYETTNHIRAQNTHLNQVLGAFGSIYIFWRWLSRHRQDVIDGIGCNEVVWWLSPHLRLFVMSWDWWPPSCSIWVLKCAICSPTVTQSSEKHSKNLLSGNFGSLECFCRNFCGELSSTLAGPLVVWALTNTC